MPDIQPVEHRNRTPFPSQYFPVLDAQGEAHHVVVTRITYDLTRRWGDDFLHDARHQPWLTEADVWSSDPRHGAPAWESDFAPDKPRCDVLVANAVTRPSAQPTTGSSVKAPRQAQRWPCGLSLTWDDAQGRQQHWHKTLIATGPRQHDALGGVTDPALATETPLAWQHAFGGERREPATDTATEPAGSRSWTTDERNPLGSGWDNRPGQPAPRLEVSLAQPYRGQRDYPAVNLGAVGRSWTPRRALAGTYDADWQAQQWPLPPLDADPAYWNCAPADQQLDFLTPGATLQLLALYSPTNERPWPAQYRCRLPLREVFVYAYYPDVPGRGPSLPAQLDTLVIDMASLQLSVTYRTRLRAMPIAVAPTVPLHLETRSRDLA